jgi:outer membrane protein OmpA-like peptidoglycan-associated protein
MLTGSAYFYIDDVSVILLDPDPVLQPEPLVWIDGREIKTEETYILNNIQFEFNRFALLPVSFPELDRLASILKERTSLKAELNGHTDDVGSDDYNLELSRNRAQSVGDYLKAKGVSGERLIINGYGKQKPLVQSKDDSARTLNRRVEVRFIK